MLMVTLQLSEKAGLKLNIPQHETFYFVSIYMVLFVAFKSELFFFLAISRGPAWATVLKSSSLNRAMSSVNSCESISRRSGGIWEVVAVKTGAGIVTHSVDDTFHNVLTKLSIDFVCHLFKIETRRVTTLCVLHVGSQGGTRQRDTWYLFSLSTRSRDTWSFAFLTYDVF